MKGFLHKSSGCAKGWNGDGKYAPDRAIVPGCGGIIVAAECDRMFGWPAPTGGIPLNSPPSVGGRTVFGIAPGNVGETAKRKKERNSLIICSF